MGALVKYVCALIVCMVLMVSPMGGEAAISCGQVTSTLSPCISYLKTGGAVTPGCCMGVKSLNRAANSAPGGRKATCNCLKAAASSIPGIKADAAATLPHKCGVNIPYKIATSTNCATVK